MTITHARNEDHPSTEYFQFEPKRDKRAGNNSASTVDENPGFSPISRWLTATLDNSDFASNPDATGYRAQFIVPRDTIALQCVVRVDEAFDNASSVNIGDGSDADGWAQSLNLTGTGLKIDPDAAYQPGGSGGGKYYEDGDTVDVETATGTVPSQGKALLFLKIISYHEDAEAEW